MRPLPNSQIISPHFIFLSHSCPVSSVSELLAYHPLNLLHFQHQDTMRPTPEEQLLQMTISGKLPPDLQQSFDSERVKGNAAYREARFDDAIFHYNEAERINPMSPIPPANRSMVFIKLHQFEKAKQEAAVAHELHQALPAEERSNTLLVKILLRRATANKQLLLLALAAEDYRAVLDLEQNQVAEAELSTLKEKYNVNPSRFDIEAATRHSGGKIHVVDQNENSISSDRNVMQTESHSQTNLRSKLPRTPVSSQVQDETTLVQLPQAVISGLVSKWSSVPPRSPDEFERVWRSLHGNMLAQSTYLLETVGHASIRDGILGDTLTPQVLERIITVLAAAVEHNPVVSTKVAHILVALTTVSRFQMLLMFLSPAERKPIGALLKLLRDNDVPRHQLHTLHQSYA